MPKFKIRLRETVYHDAEIEAANEAEARMNAQVFISEGVLEFWETNSDGLVVMCVEAADYSFFLACHLRRFSVPAFWPGPIFVCLPIATARSACPVSSCTAQAGAPARPRIHSRTVVHLARLSSNSRISAGRLA